VAGADLRSLSPQSAKSIGSSGSCNIDVACVVPMSQALLDAARSVARLTFVADDGGSYLCTGTLVNDSVTSFTPYLFTANHCIDSAATARTLNTYWFYDAAICNDRNTPQFVQLAGGAALLGRSPDFDWALVRLLEAPPTGVVFSAWRSDRIPLGAVVTAIHHPRGDLKKWSQGTLTDFGFFGDLGAYGNFNQVTWTAGTTEGGSSGGALFTFLQGAGYYEVRGGLLGGGASCANPTFPDYYSDLGEALPVLRQYLTPNASNPAGVVVATEFYNRALDHYFISTDPDEINDLDSGATIGWVRTGLRFLAYGGPVAGANPVCRFYRTPSAGDSHFYSADPAECTDTALKFPVDWIYESPNVFYVPLPDKATGACPAGTKVVYRYFNTFTVNHRYTVEVTVRDQLAADPVTWTAEGYGPGPYLPIMCALG
jgi:lysyl endopeptidase